MLFSKGLKLGFWNYVDAIAESFNVCVRGCYTITKSFALVCDFVVFLCVPFVCVLHYQHTGVVMRKQ